MGRKGGSSGKIGKVSNLYNCWYAANIANTSVFDALSIGRGLVVAAILCIKHK